MHSVWHKLLRLASAVQRPSFSRLEEFVGVFFFTSGDFEDILLAPALVMAFYYIARAAFSIISSSLGIF